MRICIEVKDNKAQHFRLFVEFLRHWFTTRELERRHAVFQHDAPPNNLDRIHVEEAVRCSLADRHEPFVDALQDRSGCGVGKSVTTGAWQRFRRPWCGMAAAPTPIAYGCTLSCGRAKASPQLRPGGRPPEKYPDNATLQYHLTHAYFIEDRFAEALCAIDRAIALRRP